MDFFNGNKKNNYGDIAFIQMNSNEYDGILKEAKNCNYIFISYLDNKKNYELASQINNCYQNKSIQYIATKGYDQDDMHSVIIDKEYSQLQNYDRMKESSLSFVLSLKYKLYSLGINADDASAAKLFKQKIDKADNLEKIAWIEHRRWVTEKLVSVELDYQTPIGIFNVYSYYGIHFQYAGYLGVLRENEIENLKVNHEMYSKDEKGKKIISLYYDDATEYKHTFVKNEDGSFYWQKTEIVK